MPKFKTPTGKTIYKPYKMKTSGKRIVRNPPKHRLGSKNTTSQRKAFAKTRQPFTEIKARDHKELWESLGGTAAERDTITDPYVPKYLITPGINAPQKLTFLPVWSYYNPVRGLDQTDMLGQYLTPKFLKMKLSFRPPKAYLSQPLPGSVRDASPRIFVIHGWMTNNLNLNQFTTPTREGLTRSDFIEYMTDHISQKWASSGRQNSLDFREATQSDIKILGYKRIRQPQQNQISIPLEGESLTSTTSTSVGQQPVVEFSLNWRMNNRKVKYSKGTNQMTDKDFLYPNDSWVPFVLIYQPDSDYQASGQNYSWSFAYNDKTWFSDS